MKEINMMFASSYCHLFISIRTCIFTASLLLSNFYTISSPRLTENYIPEDSDKYMSSQDEKTQPINGVHTDENHREIIDIEVEVIEYRSSDAGTELDTNIEHFQREISTGFTGVVNILVNEVNPHDSSEPNIIAEARREPQPPTDENTRITRFMEITLRELSFYRSAEAMRRSITRH